MVSYWGGHLLRHTEIEEEEEEEEGEGAGGCPQPWKRGGGNGRGQLSEASLVRALVRLLDLADGTAADPGGASLAHCESDAVCLPACLPPACINMNAELEKASTHEQ
jgi:hypothetical protein